MVDRLKRIASRTDAWIIRHRWSRVFRRSIIGFLHHNALNNAGSMAYFAILSVFQLLVLGVVVLSFFLGDGKARSFVIEQVSGATPLAPDTITAIIDGVIESRGGVSIVSLVLLAWSGLGIFSALNRGIASAFVLAKKRSFIQDKLVGLSLIVIAGALVLTSFLVGILTGILQQLADDTLGGLAGRDVALGAVGFVIPILLIFLAFLAIYRITPNRQVSLAEVWPGALVATVLWSILRIGFTYYATSVANYNSAFGPISTGVSLLVFLYFASVVVLLGAEVARASVLDDEIPAPTPVLASAVAADAPRRDAGSTGEPQGAQTAGDSAPARPLPAWALAIGGAVAGGVVRWLSQRATSRDS